MKIKAIEFQTDRFECVRVTRRCSDDKTYRVVAYRHACLEHTSIHHDFPDGGRNVMRIAQDMCDRLCNDDEWGDNEIDELAQLISTL